MRRALLVSVVVVVSGCDCGSPPMPDGGTDAGALLDGGVDGGLDAGPADAFTVTFDGNFGAVLRGQFVERTARITNEGPGELSLDGFATSGDPSFTLTGGMATRLAPQQSLELTVRFTAGAHGVAMGSLDFRTNGFPQRSLLTGESIGPAARLMPMLIDLGDVPLYGGTTAVATTELGVENIGRDTATHRPDTDLRVTFDVAQLTGDPATVCVNDCLPDALDVTVGAAISPSVRVSATSPGARSFQVRVFSNDPTQPLLTIEVRFNVVPRALCQFQTTPLDFGVLSLGEPRALEVLFENVGTEPCEIAAAFVDTQVPETPAPIFEVVEPQTFPIVVPPGNVQRSLVRAIGQDVTPRATTARLELEVNAPSRYASTALAAHMLQSPVLIGLTRPLDFGDIKVGCSSRAIPLLLDAPVQTVQLASAAFQLTPQVSQTTTVRFTPTVAGPVHEHLAVLWSTDGGVERTTVELLGTGVASAQRTETFTVGPGAVDLLIAVDDDATMVPYAITLEQQLTGLPGALATLGIDAHLAVVTCGDTTAPGVLRATSTGERYVTTSTPMANARFTSLLSVGGQVPGHACKRNVTHALTFPLVNTSNAGFRRDGVPLGVVQITASNEVDQALAPQVLELAQRLPFSWSAVAPVTGNAHLSVVTPSGGVRVDVDGTSWATAVEHAVAVTNSPRRFVLNGKPNAASLEVRVDGQLLPAGMFWTWDAQANAVVFTPAGSPEPGDVVSVTFSAECTP